MPSVLLLTTGDRLLLTTGDALLLALSEAPGPAPGPVDAHALACVVTPFCPEDEEP